MEFKITSKEHGTTTDYYWLTLQPEGGGPDIEITIVENTDHTTGYTDHEVLPAEGSMPGSEDDMEAEEQAIAYVKENVTEIIRSIRGVAA